MITLDAIIHTAINPALQLLPPQMDSDAARVELLAIGLQESQFTFRFQKVPGNPYAKGPALGFWQNEVNGVIAVLGNPATKGYAVAILDALKLPHDPGQVHAQLEFNDPLAAGFARLLLWADPHPLPAVDDADGGWQTYLRCWRPGKPRPDDWPANHAAARGQVFA